MNCHQLKLTPQKGMLFYVVFFIPGVFQFEKHRTRSRMVVSHTINAWYLLGKMLFLKKSLFLCSFHRDDITSLLFPLLSLRESVAKNVLVLVQLLWVTLNLATLPLISPWDSRPALYLLAASRYPSGCDPGCLFFHCRIPAMQLPPKCRECNKLWWKHGRSGGKHSVVKRMLCQLDTKYNFSSSLQGIN